MDNYTKVSFPSIFDTAVESEKDFDTIFGGEEDCDLMDVVCGLKEDGTALPPDAELHQTDDDALPKDLRDELGEGHDTKNKPCCDSSDADVLNKKEGNNISCKKGGVQDCGSTSVDDEDIEGAFDKEAKRFHEAYVSLMREAAEDAGEEFEDEDVEGLEEGKDCKKGDCKKDDDEDLVSDLDDDSDDDDDDSKDKKDDDDDDEDSDDKKDDEDLVSDLDDDSDDDDSSDEDEEDIDECGDSEKVAEGGDEDLVSDLDDDDDDDYDESVEESNEDLREDPDEEDLINSVEDDAVEYSPEELERELNTDEDEDLIDIVAGEEE